MDYGDKLTPSPWDNFTPPRRYAVPSALEIVGRAMQHLEERQSVFAECELEALALGHSPGRHSIGEIRDAVEWMVRDGHLVEAQLRRSDRSFVTRRALKAERSVIATMKAGRYSNARRQPRLPFDSPNGVLPSFRRHFVQQLSLQCPCPCPAFLR